jgi:uncharacterized protein (TIGR02646 family)
MKHIVKQPEPAAFRRWKSAYPTAIYNDLHDDHRFPGANSARYELRRSLYDEQRGLCCYCEKLLTDNDFHVEHFRPKAAGMFPALQLSYGNLHACCGRVPSGSVDEHCGHKKSDDFDSRLISPLNPNCASHFRYDLAGNIFGTDADGTLTVNMLNLNSVLLVRSRKMLIEEFEDCDDVTYDADVAQHLNASASPLGEFYTTIQYLHNAGLLH